MSGHASVASGIDAGEVTAAARRATGFSPVWLVQFRTRRTWQAFVWSA